jgi:putative ABC transport system permease protein
MSARMDLGIGARLRSWWQALAHRSRVETEMDTELKFHIEQRAEELMRQGAARGEAERRAKAEFGGVERAKEEGREARGIAWVDMLQQDLRYAMRTLRKSPGFVAVAVGTLALAIGANTAIFSVVYAVLLRPLPYPNPGQLVVVFESKPQDGVKETGASYLDFQEWQKDNHVFEEISGNAAHWLTLTGLGEPSEVGTVVMTPEALDVVGVKPVLGRTFYASDGLDGAAPVAVVSEVLWRGQLGGDPKIIGKTIVLDKKPFMVIGVMPAAFHYPLLDENAKRDVWIPLAQDPLFSGWRQRRGGHWLLVLGRLKPGISVTQAQAEMNTLAASMGKENPVEDAGWGVRLVPLREETVGDVRTALLVLLGAVALVLLIACANVANLLLTRATGRTREMAVRIAIGAGRGRIVRQLLTESAVLGILGGGLGIALAYWGVKVFIALLPAASLPRSGEIRVDGWVLAFAVALSVAVSFLFGLAPALFAADSDVQTNLKEASRTGASGGSGQGARKLSRNTARNVLAAAEIALAMVVLVASGLLVRSFVRLTEVQPGFKARNVLMSEIDLPQFEYSTPQQWIAFSDTLLGKLQAEPGMRDTAVGIPLPLAQGFVNLGFDIEGAPPPRPGTLQDADFVAISPGYFGVMGIPLMSGRGFTDQDNFQAPKVAIISETLARMYFPNQNPIGKRMSFGFPPNGKAPREIVGVVGDVRDRALNQAPPAMMYAPFNQAPFWGVQIVVKTNLSASSVAATVHKDVAQMDKDLPVAEIVPMQQLVENSMADTKFRTCLFGLFAVIALILSGAGIFGVISYLVSNRTHEIGIRIALGANRTSVVELILGQSAKLVAVGLLVGIPVSFVLARLMGDLLYVVGPADPATFVGVTVVLAFVALVASYVPMRRAMKVDPMVALRYE